MKNGGFAQIYQEKIVVFYRHCGFITKHGGFAMTNCGLTMKNDVVTMNNCGFTMKTGGFAQFQKHVGCVFSEFYHERWRFE